MPLLHDDLLSFPGFHGCESRCRVRVFLPAEGSGSDAYIVLATDDDQAQGTSVTNAAEIIAAVACQRFNLPPERLEFIEHYDYRHRPGGANAFGEAENFARISFSRATAAALPGALSPTLGLPSWQHTDRVSVEELIGEALP